MPLRNDIYDNDEMNLVNHTTVGDLDKAFKNRVT